MAAARLLPATGRRIRQRDGIPVYSCLIVNRDEPIPGSSFIPTRDPLKTTPLKDKIATLSSQEPYTVPLFSLWLCVSIAADTLRQYNENYYH
ncbi:hypothetical protein AL515_22665 [Citrobacter sp. FDAARGOS_156]|nr:hypothetical protein AL515_22665 [Citrobacter sp. FDAARGOS_156]